MEAMMVMLAVVAFGVAATCLIARLISEHPELFTSTSGRFAHLGDEVEWPSNESTGVVHKNGFNFISMSSVRRGDVTRHKKS